MKVQISSINIGDIKSLIVLRILRNALLQIKEQTQYEGIISEDDNTYICDTNDILLSTNSRNRKEGEIK